MAKLVTNKPRERLHRDPQGLKRRSRGLVVIELIGVPGAGKTTVAGVLEEALRDSGTIPYDVVKAARVFAERTALGRLMSRLLPGSRIPAALWGVYLLYSWVYAVVFSTRNPRLLRYLMISQRRRPAEADVAARKVRYWYLRLVGSYEFLVAKGYPGEVLVLDEGFVHRVVQLHASEVERPEADAISRYLQLVPEPDAVIHVRAPLDVCVERIRLRGVWERYQRRDRGRLSDFLESADRAVVLAAESIRRAGWSIDAIDNVGDPAEIRSKIEDLVKRDGERVGDWTQTREASSLYTICLPRPGRVREIVKARFRTVDVSKETAQAVVELFGFDRIAGFANVPMGWRNRNVVINTEHGARVLREYPERWTTDAIVFEHSILQRLAEIDYPAPRLVPARAGATLVSVAGSRWALFEFVDGSNLAGCFLRPIERAHLAHLAGELLARFHGDLEGFVPEGRHHLGFHVGDDRSPNMSWYSGALDELTGSPTGSDEDAGLRSRAAELADRLAVLAETIARAPVSTAVIHGDFDFHNILFRRDGGATVLDFELARIDWRLIDLVRVLSHQKRHAGRAFVAGYRRKSRIGSDEWQYLPEVWEFYRLAGAVRSWHNGKVLGDPRRLITADRRIEEADWIAAHRLAPWERPNT